MARLKGRFRRKVRNLRRREGLGGESKLIGVWFVHHLILQRLRWETRVWGCLGSQDRVYVSVSFGTEKVRRLEFLQMEFEFEFLLLLTKVFRKVLSFLKTESRVVRQCRRRRKRLNLSRLLRQKDSWNPGDHIKRVQ